MNLEQLSLQFKNQFPDNSSKPLVFFSPGRVNLIGEHTDYNGGFVFPCALSFGTYLVIAPNQKDVIRFASGNFPTTFTVPQSKITEKQGNEWINYPLGVINQFLKVNISVSGLDMYFYGNIPNGAGLSSSASIEVVTAVALNDLLHTSIDRVELVKMCQRAENQFVGVNCGIMDQFAVAMGKKDHAIQLDCNSLKYSLVPVKLNGYKLVIANTNKRRGLADSKYNERRSECDKAVEYLNKKVQIQLLCELSLEDFKKVESCIPDPIVKKRAQHAISENQRTNDAVSYLQKGELVKFGELMNASHDSLRDDYEVTGIELDTLVEEARKIAGVIGSRMTGAGFGGCTVSLVKEASVEDFIQQVGNNYSQKTGLKADFYVAEIGDGAKRID